MIRKKKGSLLIQLVVALALGFIIVLQFTSFLIGFVQDMSRIAAIERRYLQESTALDLLYQDLTRAEEVNISVDGRVATLSYYRLREGEGMPEPITIIWRSGRGGLQRSIEGAFTPQVFGAVLVHLNFNPRTQIFSFRDVEGRQHEICWA